MRDNTISGTDLVASCLGMGCASLGSRVSSRRGRRMLEAAYEAGITWYDIAPSYGAGRAEEIFAPFLAAHRDRVSVTGKVGLGTPRRNHLLRLAYDIGRPVVGLAGGLRRRFRAMPSTRNVRLPLTPELIETSLAASLARLGTDHLDVLALHDPDPADIDRDDVLRALERIRNRGDARHIAIAGGLEAAEVAARHPLFALFQLADDPASRPLTRLRALVDHPAGFVVHSVLGVGGARDRLTALLAADDTARRRAASLVGDANPGTLAARLLMARAFATATDGVVLASMYTSDHLDQGVAAAGHLPDPAIAVFVEALFARPTAFHEGKVR